MANSYLIQAPEVLSEIVITASETLNAAKSARIQKDNFKKFSTYLERITFALKELSKYDINNSEPFKNAIEILNMQITVAKQLTLECSTRNKIYLLLNTRKIVKRLERSTKEIGRSIGLIPLSSCNVSSNLNDEITKIHKSMLDTEYRVDISDEEILEKIEAGIQERNVDSSYANSLLISIAESIGISTDQSSLRKEFEDFKYEMESVEQRKDMLEFIQIEQIVLLLGKADVIATLAERESKYFSKRNSLGKQQVEPLQSFYCPITGDVMVDPVETSTGHTFERSAIEKWLADGKHLCPLTMTPLKSSAMRSNKTLRQSIEEWKDRNMMITIASMKSKIMSNEDDEVIEYIMKLEDLCRERRLHREWVIMEDYIPILISLLCAKNFKIREKVLVVLCILARDSDDNKETIAGIDKAIEYIVSSLARKVEESKLALKLLLELSGSNVVRNSVGNVQGCILLLVTLSSSDDTQAAKDAQELLDNLSCLDHNVIQMARANFFGPLLHLLSSGSENVQMVMAKTLSEIELTDHSKLRLCKDGALGPLIKMLSHSDIEMKKVAVKALQNLSSEPQNGLQMIKEGAVSPLFEILYRQSLSLPSLREQVAATIMHLAVAIADAQEADELEVSFLESEEDIFKFFSLISLTGPDVQQSILRAFYAICQSPSGFDIRSNLRKLSAVQVLVQLCEAENDKVRASAVKLFCSLTEDGEDSTFLEHVNQRCIETLLKVIKTSNNGEEIVASMRIISNLPKDSHMTQSLLDAGALQVIFANLTSGNTNSPYNTELTESATKALCHFTVPTNQEWQKRVAESGFIPILVQLLIYGTSFTKQNAAISLKQFSESSIALSTPVKTRGVFGCCWAPPEVGCPVHSGACAPESSFCLLMANAVGPLTGVISEPHLGACEASLDALLTLIEGELLQKGSKVLSEVNAIGPIIKLLGSNSDRVQEKALKALERIFRLVEFKQQYGVSAQMLLVDITQRGNTGMKSLAAKILAHLNVLHEQSSFF